jgi:hypothetical protein
LLLSSGIRGLHLLAFRRHSPVTNVPSHLRAYQHTRHCRYISDSVTSIDDRESGSDDDYTNPSIYGGSPNFPTCLGLGLPLTRAYVARGIVQCLPCYNRTTITVPDNVTSISDYAFANCAHLSTVIIGNSVTSIGANAFHRLVSLTMVVISDSVTFIDDYAFSRCLSLVSIEFPNSITQTGTLLRTQLFIDSHHPCQPARYTCVVCVLCAAGALFTSVKLSCPQSTTAATTHDSRLEIYSSYLC